MALSMNDAHGVIRDILANQRADEFPRLERIDEALRVKPYDEFEPTAIIPPDAPVLYKRLAFKAHTNYLRLALKEYAQLLKVDSYITESDEGARDPWYWWQRNRMDARQLGLARSTLKYGVGYAHVHRAEFGFGPSATTGPAARLFSPRQMTAVYGDSDEWPMYALHVSRDDLGVSHVTLIDEEREYIFGQAHAPAVVAPGLGHLSGASLANVGNLEPIEWRQHGMGFTPVVRFMDRWLLEGEQQLGIIEPLMVLQERIDEVEYEKLIAQYFTAFRQRWVKNWTPETPEEELRSTPGAVWYVKSTNAAGETVNVEVGEFSQTSLDGYHTSAAAARRDFAAIAQIPTQNLGVDGVSNISGEALESMNSVRNLEAGEIATSMGESYEQLMRLFAFIDGNGAAAADHLSEVRWADFNQRTFGQMVDGLTKLVAADMMTPEDALEDVPGMTKQRAERIMQNTRRKRASDMIGILGGNASR